MNQNYLLTAMKAGHNELVRKLVENGINTIYEYANLRGCTGITSLDGITFRRSADLTGCTGITSLSNVTFMEDAYLKGCTGIASLSGITFRGYAYLYGCQPHIIEQVRNMGVNVIL